MEDTKRPLARLFKRILFNKQYASKMIDLCDNLQVVINTQALRSCMCFIKQYKSNMCSLELFKLVGWLTYLSGRHQEVPHNILLDK